MKGIRAISYQEASEIAQRDTVVSGKSKGAHGTGFVRIQNTSEKFLVASDISKMPEKICPRHGNSNKLLMTIMRVKNRTSLNAPHTVFYKCNQQIYKNAESNIMVKCDYNIYPFMDLTEFKEQEKSHDDRNDPIWIPKLPGFVYPDE